MRADKRGRLLSEPPRKLTVSATQALCTGLRQKNACILTDGVDAQASAFMYLYFSHDKLVKRGFVMIALDPRVERAITVYYPFVQM
jgi:hypothetical protein